MTAKKPAPRALIYSFQMDAARQLLDSEDPPDISKGFQKRLQRAIRYNIDSPLFSDPELFDSEVRQAGRWWTLWPKDDRMRIKGTVQSDCKQVALFVNDRMVKLINTVPRHNDELNRRVFRFNVKADILKSLPRKTVIGVGSRNGFLRHRGGGLTYRDDRLSGNARLFRLLDKSHFLTKKGRLQRRLDQNEKWKKKALTAYTSFSDYFEATFGYQPYIICGTLLGYFREGDFIAHDDDMDVAYFSKHSSPQDIAAELKEIVYKMMRDGYDIKLSKNRGFFKPTINGFSFDVFPMWHDQDCLWMMNTTRQRTAPDTIMPVGIARFRGVNVYVPHQIERYIENEYGPNWRVPDPGYRAVGEQGTAAYLADSCISKDDVRALHEDIASASAESSGIGTLTIADTNMDQFLA